MQDNFEFSRFNVKPRATRATPAFEAPVPSSFQSLGIAPSLQVALSGLSISTPTEVQVACIPPLLSGKFPTAKVMDRCSRVPKAEIA